MSTDKIEEDNWNFILGCSSHSHNIQGIMFPFLYSPCIINVVFLIVFLLGQIYSHMHLDLFAHDKGYTTYVNWDAIHVESNFSIV